MALAGDITTLTVAALGGHQFTVIDAEGSRYAVDARCFAWNGSCTCSTFTGCCRPLLKATEKRWRCAHIEAVRAHLMEYEYPALIDRAEKIIEMPLAPHESAADIGE